MKGILPIPVTLSRESRVTQDSQQILTEQLIKVRTIAQRSLARFAKADPNDCKEVYLFSKDQFCGVRFTLGPFQADWRINESSVMVQRGDSQLEVISLNEASTNRAA